MLCDVKFNRENIANIGNFDAENLSTMCGPSTELYDENCTNKIFHFDDVVYTNANH